MFGLGPDHRETLYDEFAFALEPGQILAVVGPSGSGKSVLLDAAAEQIGRDGFRVGRPGRWLADRLPVDLLRGGSLRQRLESLAAAGLGEARTLLTPAGELSDGQRYRLALARAIHPVRCTPRPAVLLADEFCSTLDTLTATVLARNLRRLVGRYPLAVLLATPRTELLDAIGPDRLIVKPLGSPPRFVEPGPARSRLAQPRRWRVRTGSIADYRALEQYHYIAGPPAAHKRVYVIRTPRRYRQHGSPVTAAVAVVSPPVIGVRGRNVATDGRYLQPDRRGGLRRLNAEVETISRVIVHPMFRGCGLAVRLVRHVLHTSPMPIVEALAAMGKIHPFFVRGGMTPAGLFKGRTQYYHYYLARTGATAG
jgi:ABC-type ATPase with predicted acetyltransferase domain